MKIVGNFKSIKRKISKKTVKKNVKFFRDKILK